MSTQFTNRQWRLPNEENKSKVSNYSLSFDGSSYIDAGNDTILQFQPTDAFTLSCWFNASSYSSNSIIVSNNEWTGAYRGYNLQLTLTGVLRLTITSSYTPSNNNIQISYSTTINTGSWYHIVITKDTSIANTGLNMYINGSLASVTRASSGTLSAFTYVSDFNVGGVDNGNQLFNGQIDGVAIFNYALSSSQVTTLYGSSSTGIGNPMSLSPKPVAYYPLGDQDAFNGASYLTPNASLKDFVFDFDGANVDYISNNVDLSSATSLTISGWINRDSTSDGQWLTAFGNTNNGHAIGVWFGLTRSTWSNLHQPVTLSLNVSGTFHRLGGQWQNDTTLPTRTIDIGKWYHVAATWDGTVMKLFLNGELADQLTASSSWTLEAGTISGSIVGEYFRGQMSNFNIWVNNYLSATEVATLYNNGSPIQTLSDIPQNSNLQAWYKLDASATYDGSNWTIPDDSSNSNTGTSSGMTQANLVQSDLSFTSGYSPYALDFDGTNDYIDFGNDSSLNISTSSYSISFWIKTNDSGITVISQKANDELAVWINNSKIQWNGANPLSSISLITGDVWKHVCLVTNSSNSYIYINGVEDATVASTQINSTTSSDNFRIGGRNTQYSYEGLLSNWAFYNTALTPAQVTELYNEGVPSNLNNHSAYSNLVSWWQLGSNSSFNTNWTVLDEKGSNNGTSVNMTEDDIVDGIGSYANGLSSGMGGDEVIGDAPYSTANSLSINMDVLDRTEDTPA
jgi:hypothetical protein